MEDIRVLTPDARKHAYLAVLFTDPDDVLSDQSLSSSEKRSILASWASDARAVEGSPTLRYLDSGAIVPITEILAALKKLDAPPSPGRRKSLLSKRQRMMLMGEVRRFRSPPDDDDDPPPVPALSPRPKPPKIDAESVLPPYLEAAMAA